MAYKDTILIVDDQKINRVMLSDVLEQDYMLLFAEDGKQAIEILENNASEISVMILDIIMPKVDGFEVLKRMQLSSVYSKIPVIVITTQTSYENEVKALKLGAVDFITKPFSPDVLTYKLQNLIRYKNTTNMFSVVKEDFLTGVFSKDYFYQLVNEQLLLSEGQSYDMLVADIENFKLINDSFGVEEGDKLLQYFANVIRECARRYHGIVGRIGGDHFALLLPCHESGREKTEKLEHDIADEITASLMAYPLKFRIYAKLGVYQCNNTMLTISQICDRAMLAAQEIKGNYNVNISYYDDAIRQRLLLEQEIEGEMKTALETGQFQVFFQPKFSIKDEKHAGAEALVRWIHPEKGIIPPGQFVPIFERNGFISELDLYVMRQTCDFIANQKRNHLPYVPISVNVSRRDIYNESLPQVLSKIVESYQLDISDIHLEITETSYTENSQQLIGVITKLKQLGFVIEMDDFGSGYSSLNMLSELPIDVLKLDMRFLQNSLNAYSQNSSILSFIISLAKWMNISVVAEGVETKSQLEYLRNLNCDYAQGYYFAKPMPRDEYYAMMEHAQVTKVEIEDDLSKQGIRITGVQEGEVMMIVDDMKINRIMLSNIFQDTFKIVECSNGQEALDYLSDSSHRVDVILLDLLMPLMDGYETMRLLKLDPNRKQIPIIIVSQPGESNEIKALKMGASDYITKPFNALVVRKRVSNAIAEQRFRKMISYVNKDFYKD
ncbi:EAL domain-containing protein [Eubacterium oxidoreducens]|uniref:Stage 0 sporulation protein A homolog n=1 Tax=Eubacterium oxidoreducens TaxID=1732 RepID=A0A1G6APD3_EUBOX|nr:EAL domain-containing protein [Eubacterium oxidoreducens]SDB10222.1 diguanylate cyclase (GGDEF) domain-containing protein [Eubacterium oxidoreducens]